MPARSQGQLLLLWDALWGASVHGRPLEHRVRPQQLVQGLLHLPAATRVGCQPSVYCLQLAHSAGQRLSGASEARLAPLHLNEASGLSNACLLAQTRAASPPRGAPGHRTGHKEGGVTAHGERNAVAGPHIHRALGPIRQLQNDPGVVRVADQARQHHALDGCAGRLQQRPMSQARLQPCTRACSTVRKPAESSARHNYRTPAAKPVHEPLRVR